MAKRPDYVPPIRLEERPNREPSPKAMLLELLLAPPTTGVLAGILLANGHTLVGLGVVAVSVIVVVQAIIYVPRAFTAIREGHRW